MQLPHKVPRHLHAVETIWPSQLPFRRPILVATQAPTQNEPAWTLPQSPACARPPITVRLLLPATPTPTVRDPDTIACPVPAYARNPHTPMAAAAAEANPISWLHRHRLLNDTSRTTQRISSQCQHATIAIVSQEQRTCPRARSPQYQSSASRRLCARQETTQSHAISRFGTTFLSQSKI